MAIGLTSRVAVLLGLLACSQSPKSELAAQSGTPSSSSAPATAPDNAGSSPVSGSGGTRAVIAPQPAASGGARSEPARAGLAGAAGTQGAGGRAAVPDEVDAGAGQPSPPARESLCSGCPQEMRAQDMKIHLHHVHLNVADRERSAQFYEKFFDGKRVLLNGVDEALRVTPTLILLEQRALAPKFPLPTALQHMGWGSTDVGGWYEHAHAAGIAPDTRGHTLFNTRDTPSLGESGTGAIIGLLSDVPACYPIPDKASYMYVLGPDQERIEVWSGVDQRVNHVHFTTADLAATASWYQRFLGLPSMTPLLSYSFFLDDILFFFEPDGASGDYEPTDDHALGHFALSVTDLDAWRKRVADQHIEVVSEPAPTHGFTSFFIRGPDGALIELVQAAALPELCPMR